MTILKSIAICFGILLIFQSNLKGQSSDSEPQGVQVELYTLALGPALTKEDLAYNFGVGLKSEVGLLQFRVNGIYEGIRVLADEPLEHSQDIGLLFGKSILLGRKRPESNLFLSILGGVAVVRIIEQGDLISAGNIGGRRYEEIKHIRMGFPYEVSVSSSGNRFGVKVALSGNVNQEESYSGITVGFLLRLP